MKKYWRKKTFAAALVFAAAMSLAACSGTEAPPQQEAMETEEQKEAQQVAGAGEQVVYGYILEVNTQARTIMVDGFTLVSAVDTQARADLGLTDDSHFYNGYYLSNEGARLLYPLGDKVRLELSDFDYSGSKDYLGRYGMDKEMAALDAKNAAARQSVNEHTDGISESYMDNEYGVEGNGPSLSQLDKEARENEEPLTEKENDEKNNGAQGTVDNAEPFYSGTELDRLSARIEEAEYIPFRIFLTDGKVTRIMEMDSLYR